MNEKEWRMNQRIGKWMRESRNDKNTTNDEMRKSRKERS